VQSRIEWREEQRRRLRERVPALSSSEFVARHVRSLLKERGSEAGCKVDLVWSRPTGRMTLRYVFDDGVTIYGKVYTDGLGLASYSTLQQLWGHGFGFGSPDRVPEPLGFCAEENLVLIGAARGAALDALLLHEPIEHVLPAVRAAARWLARLHASTVAGLPPEPVCNRVKVFKLADRLGKAAASHPDDLGLLLGGLQRLRILAPTEQVAFVTTHGQYSPANVFVDGSDVTIIDVDRLSISDPAKDVAMFLFGAISLRAKATGAVAETERIGSEFMHAYQEHAGRSLENLPYYSALFPLSRLAKCAKDHARGDPVRQQAEPFHLDRFERCFSGGVVPPGDASACPDHKAMTLETVGRIVTEYLSPHQPPTPGSARPDLGRKTTVVQNTGTGRVTIRYEFDAATVIFAKRYVDALGAHSYRVQRAFWESGFGNSAKFRVPEPLAFFAEHNLFLMRGSTGVPLAALLGDRSGQWKAGVREAARWLAGFHRSPLRVGDPEPEWDSLKTFRLATLLVTAAAAQPSKRALVLDLMHMLKERFAALPGRRPVVQTHGRFHHEHVFLSPEAVTVIDLDRSRPTDPAKDAAEFVRVLRLAAFRAGVEEALTDKVTEAFLAQYLALVPGAAAGLPHYWLSFLVLSYLGHLRKALPDGASAAVTAFHEREIRRVSEMST